jgi:hypothetical protein
MRHNSKAKCLICGAVVESKHRHDYVVCGCAQHTMADGGSDYGKYGGKNLNHMGIWDGDKFCIRKDEEAVMVTDPEEIRKILVETVQEKRDAWAILDQLQKKLYKLERQEDSKAFAKEMLSLLNGCKRSVAV